MLLTKIAEEMVTWARNKYGQDAEYMVLETNEALEGFLEAKYAEFEDAFDKILKIAKDNYERILYFACRCK